MKIIPFQKRYTREFEKLNRAWLEGFGLLEDGDLKHLKHPRKSIIDKGGQIFLAVEDGAVLGTSAAIPHSKEMVEIAKLAVAPPAQGRGIGRMLVQRVIEHAQGMGARKLTLYSNSRLEKALRLYESMGFKHAPLPADIVYATADIYMEMRLAGEDSD